MKKYRITKKFAWLPTYVWSFTNTSSDGTHLGEWKRVWLKYWYIIESANVISDCGGVLLELEPWKFFTGNYANHSDALKDLNLI